MIDRPVARANNVINRNEFRHQNEPGGGTGSTLWHAKPFVESAWGAKGSQGGSVRVGGQLNKPREKVEQWENRATTEGVKHFVEYLVDLVQMLIVNSRIPPDFFGTRMRQLNHGDMKCWMRPAPM